MIEVLFVIGGVIWIAFSWRAVSLAALEVEVEWRQVEELRKINDKLEKLSR